jgi:hypothetical protein
MDPETQFRACTKKLRFQTKDSALHHIAQIWLAGKGHGLKAYKCFIPDQPEHWHIGHITPRKDLDHCTALNSLLSLTVSIARTTR